MNSYISWSFLFFFPHDKWSFLLLLPNGIELDMYVSCKCIVDMVHYDNTFSILRCRDIFLFFHLTQLLVSLYFCFPVNYLCWHPCYLVDQLRGIDQDFRRPKIHLLWTFQHSEFLKKRKEERTWTWQEPGMMYLKENKDLITMHKHFVLAHALLI